MQAKHVTSVALLSLYETEKQVRFLDAQVRQSLKDSVTILNTMLYQFCSISFSFFYIHDSNVLGKYRNRTRDGFLVKLVAQMLEQQMLNLIRPLTNFPDEYVLPKKLQ